VVGKVVRVPQEAHKTLLNQNAVIIKPDDEIDKTFLFYLLKDQQFKDYIIHTAQGAANQASITLDSIKRFRFYLPSKQDQLSIASILSAYDDLIENNTRRIQILEEMAQRIYKEWFVHFRFPGHEKVKMVDSELGKIPSGWEVKPSSKAIQYNPRIRVDKNKEKPFVPMAGLSESSMQITQVETRTGNSGAKFQNGDTLFARITPCLENGKTGYVNFLATDDTVALGSTEFIVMRSISLCPEYVYCLARSSGFRENAIKSMAGASGRQRVRSECFDSYLLAQPDDDTLEWFQRIASPIFSQVETLTRKNKNLRQTRDLLLPKLISGEIDVSQMPNPQEVVEAA
jgi:type I restriction enzyme S subunit